MGLAVTCDLKVMPWEFLGVPEGFVTQSARAWWGRCIAVYKHAESLTRSFLTKHPDLID